MEKGEIIRRMIDKCDIYYDDMLVSSEDIIEKYLLYFSSLFNSNKKIISFVFHTGSFCFDVASLVALLFTCFVFDFNSNSNDELLQSLEIGDMVLYKRERYHWGGITKGIDENSPKTEYIVLIQDAKGKNGLSKICIPYENNKHKVKPYYGESKTTDGRGIRKNKTNRNEFLSCILDLPPNKVPSILDVSVVVIADKNSFMDLCQHVYISYEDHKAVQITDIVPVSYFSANGEESQIGQNLAKEEAVIKAVSKVSVARDIILDKHRNKVIGLFATNIELMASDVSGFKDLIRRKSLQFSIVSSVYKAEFGEMVINQYEDASIFACTKEMLSSVSTEIKEPNKLTKELNKQINNIIGRETDVISIAGCWTWEEYKNIKSMIGIIFKSNWEERTKENFVVSALSLLNLFTTSFFTMHTLEKAMEEGYINSTIISPTERVRRLYEIENKNTFLQEKCFLVANSLSKMYEQLKEINPKEIVLHSILTENRGKEIALIVPKAYYVDIFNRYFRIGKGYCNVECFTANRFDTKKQYDLIIVSGDIVGKKFDSLQSFTSSKIEILLYNCEEKIFKYRKQRSKKSEQKINARIKGLLGDDLKKTIILTDDEKVEEELDVAVKEFSNLDEFVENAGISNIKQLISASGNSSTSTGMAEVNYIGAFVTGEQILFSKSYTAVVYNRISQNVSEVHPEKLVSGDVLVFAKRDDYTKNIVDMILDQLISSEKLSIEVKEAAQKSLYWKKVLREYKEDNDLTYGELAKKLKKYGSNLRDVTIRQWLDEQSHIVGPRDEITIKRIAEMTCDKNMLADSSGYFQACRVIRHCRREILSLIAQAINDKLSNKSPEPGSVFEIVYEHVDNLSEIKELDEVYALEKTAIIGVGFVNRPIVEMEVLF